MSTYYNEDYDDRYDIPTEEELKGRAENDAYDMWVEENWEKIKKQKENKE